MAILTFAGVFLHDEKHLSIASISILLLFIQLSGAGLRVWSGLYTDKHQNRSHVIRLIGLFTGISMLMLASQTGAIIALIFISGVFAHAWHGVAYTEIATRAGASYAGSAMGMAGTTTFASAFFTPLLLPYLLSASSWSGVWTAVAFAAFVASLLMSSARPSSPALKPQTQA